MIRRLLLVAVIVSACGGKSKQVRQAAAPRPDTVAERMLAMLPQGAQIVVELDLARLREYPVVGALVTRTLAVRPSTLWTIARPRYW